MRQNPEYTAVEGDTGRVRHWAFVPKLDALNISPWLRVVTLEDGETIHNAIPDRNYTRRQRRKE